MAMKLSAELFDEIISALKSDVSDPKGSEKRAEGRVGLRCALEITQISLASRNAKPFNVWVHDISVGGIGLVTTRPIEENSGFIARFHRAGFCPVPVLYSVRHCRRLSSELHSIGAAFERVLPDAFGEVTVLRKNAKPMCRKPAAPPETIDAGYQAD